MTTEYEATFTNIEKDEIRERLKKVGARLMREEFLQKRTVLLPSKEHEVGGGFLRVRDEGDKITLTHKIVGNKGIADQKETNLVVDNFESTVSLLTNIGCIPMTHEESKRELWNLKGTDITIDTWPFLEPLVEVEGKSEEDVRNISEELGFNWSAAKFCTIGTLYKEKYGIGPVNIAKETGKMFHLVFDSENPFLNYKN